MAKIYKNYIYFFQRIQVQKNTIVCIKVWWLTSAIRVFLKLLFYQSNKTITENE